MKKIEELEQQLNEIKAELEKHKQARFEVGKWYKYIESKNYGGLFNYQITNEYNRVGFGICGDLDWTDMYYLSKPYYNDYRPATESEIKEAIIKEAERRGFKYGSKVKRGNGFLNYEGSELMTDNIVTLNSGTNQIYYKEFDTLTVNGYTIYTKGQWAEIITEPVIKIGDYEVKFNDTSTISVGCQTISKETIQTILDRMK